MIKGFHNLTIDNNTALTHSSFSVIIPFRNEEENLPDLLDSLKQIKYPSSNYEIIFVDDNSSDKSVEIINASDIKNSLVIKNIRLTKSPKKDAIQTAISLAKHDWILTTDADCIVHSTWLSCLNNYINKHQPNMVVLPVKIKSNDRFIEQFQMLDFISMQGATMGGFGIRKPFMANGANLAYKKDLFFQLNGFNNNSNIASGDDIFLLENFIKFNKNKVHFLKNIKAIVITKPVKNWNSIINQRLRWAAKTKHYNSLFTKLIGVLVFISNIAMINLYFLSWALPILSVFIILKWIVDGILISKTAKFYQQKINMKSYLLTILFHPIFTTYIVFLSFFKSFVWKERVFKA